jgi:CNT family concentrative nucleoside transporter
LKKQSYFLLALCAFLFASCSRKETPGDFIATYWNYVSVKDTTGKVVKKASEQDTLKLLKVQRAGKGLVNEFSYELKQENLKAQGEWKLVGDTLLLVYDLKPMLSEIDSTSYKVDEATHEPFVVYYKDGKEVTRITQDGLLDQRQTRKFHISKIDAQNLVFEEKGVVFTFTHKTIVQETSISLTSLLRGILGILSLTLILYLISANRRAISWKLVIGGIFFQILFAVGVLKVPFVARIFESISNLFVVVLDFTRQGSEFVFNGLLDVKSFGFIFAFQVLPTIIFFSALMSLFFYLGILQKIVYGLAWLMGKAMKISGAENLSTAANIFLGQTEAPLMIKHYIPTMTRSEILCIMIGGMANTAGGVLAAYVGFLGGDDPVQQLFFAKHLLAASVMSAPATIVVAKMMLPQTEKIDEKIELSREKLGTNMLEAIANGTTDGLKLAVNVAAMLIVFIALIAMVNFILKDMIGEWTHLNDWVIAASGGQYQGFTLQFMLGYVCAPLTWLMGICKDDMVYVGQLLGEKTILNEFVAYKSLEGMKQAHVFTEQKSVIMSTYILSGFANFASIGIQIGGIGALAPNKRGVLSELGMRAMIGGAIASLFTATIVGMLI